jgi:hypothetical protein
VSAVRLLPDPLHGAGAAPDGQNTAGWPGDAPTFESAVRTLLDDVHSGRLSMATAGDRWLVRRIEEALVGFDDIGALATVDEAEGTRSISQPSGRATIAADRVAVS